MIQEIKAIGALSFVDIRKVSEQDAETVRCLRNQPEVRKFMYTDHEITVSEHAEWLNSLKRPDGSSLFFAVYQAEAVIGVVYLTGWSRAHRRSDWGYYLDLNRQGAGLGVLIEYAFLDFVFSQLSLEKLNCEVLATNPAVVQLHEKFGFQKEGVRLSHVLRDAQRIDVVLLGITEDKWLATRPRFKKLIARQTRI